MRPYLIALFLVIGLQYGTLFASSLPVTWQALPFPTDSNWGGSQGVTAVISSNEVVLQGQDARTVETYSVPVTIVLDVSIDQRTASDGSFDLRFLPPGQPLDKIATTGTIFRIIYSNTGEFGSVDRLAIERYETASTIWTHVPFLVTNQVFYTVALNVNENGALTVNIDGIDYLTTVTIPYAEFQLQIGGWQPTNVWRVREFEVRAPCSSIDDLMLKVNALEFESNRRDALLRKLVNIQDLLDRGRNLSAIKKIASFVRKLESLERKDRITDVEQSELADCSLMIQSAIPFE